MQLKKQKTFDSSKSAEEPELKLKKTVDSSKSAEEPLKKAVVSSKSSEEPQLKKPNVPLGVDVAALIAEEVAPSSVGDVRDQQRQLQADRRKVAQDCILCMVMYR